MSCALMSVCESAPLHLHVLLSLWKATASGGSEVVAYPTFAESDVPPSLPHRAETAATHAAQHLLVSISLHLRNEKNTVLS